MKDCKKKPCGCEDSGLTTPTPCVHDSLACPGADPCSETFSTDCLIYNKDSIVDIGILKGDNFTNILQIISLWLTNPVCMIPGSTCRSVLNLQSQVITNTAIKIGWVSAGTTPLSFQVEYKEQSATSWSSNPTIANNIFSDTISGLTANTTYMIRVNSICSVSQSCYSVTILVKTNT